MSNEERIRDLVATAIATAEKTLPWNLSPSMEEPDERMEASMALILAAEGFVEMIKSFDHSFPSVPVFADRIHQELGGKRFVHELVEKINEIEEPVVDEIHHLFYIAGQVKNRETIDAVVKRVVRKLYTQIALDLASGAII